MYHMKWERIRVLLSREWNWELGRCGITNKNGKSQNESYRYIEKAGHLVMREDLGRTTLCQR